MHVRYHHLVNFYNDFYHNSVKTEVNLEEIYRYPDLALLHTQTIVSRYVDEHLSRLSQKDTRNNYPDHIGYNGEFIEEYKTARTKLYYKWLSSGSKTKVIVDHQPDDICRTCQLNRRTIQIGNHCKLEPKLFDIEWQSAQALNKVYLTSRFSGIKRTTHQTQGWYIFYTSIGIVRSIDFMQTYLRALSGYQYACLENIGIEERIIDGISYGVDIPISQQIRQVHEKAAFYTQKGVIGILPLSLRKIL